MASENNLVEGVPAKEDSVIDNKKPVADCEETGEYEEEHVASRSESVKIRMLALAPLGGEEKI